MKLQELKEQTNNLTDFEMFKKIHKQINPVLISYLPQKWKNYKFIEKAKEIHGNKYNYSKASYVNKNKKVTIICPTHGEFEQKPRIHLMNSGCTKCNESKGSIKIAKFLDKNNINYVKEYSFEKNKFLRSKGNSYLRFDFYLTDLNVTIEFDGLQHFVPIKRWGGETGFKKRQKNDNIKDIFCDLNNIRLIRIKYTDYNNIDKFLKELI